MIGVIFILIYVTQNIFRFILLATKFICERKRNFFIIKIFLRGLNILISKHLQMK